MEKIENYDFKGYCTRNDIRCSDGRTIRRDAFKDCDGVKVPLVWNHNHTDADNVIGHAILENRDDGVYAYGFFNNTENGENVKSLVEHGDIVAMSIYANQLKQNGGDVLHGVIREVSLVMAGANPGAYIESVISHGEESEDAGIIYTGEEFELYHSEEGEEDTGMDEIMNAVDIYNDLTDEQKEAVCMVAASALSDDMEHADEISDDIANAVEIFNTLTEEQKQAAYMVIGMSLDEDEEDDDTDDIEVEDEEDPEDDIEHADNRTIKEIFDTLNTEQKNAVYALIGMIAEGKISPESAMEHADNGDETIKDIFDTLSEKQKNAVYAIIGMIVDNQNNEGDKNMKHNLFDNETVNYEETLSHSDMMAIIDDARENHTNSLKETVLKHGITNIDYLFPEDHVVKETPEIVKRNTGWVADVMNGVHHIPFARIQSRYADLTEDEARAKGYIKENIKAEEFFTLAKRSTTPTTIYKKQKLNRDDIADITGFDVVAWIKSEMRMMLDEEVARAILVADGRNASSDDKINELNIRPIWTDSDVYSVKKLMTIAANATEDSIAHDFIRMVIKAHKDYKGSGNPALFITEDMLTNCLLLEDTLGRRIYDTQEQLRTALRVSKIITVPVMENKTRTVGAATHTLMAIMVNLNDYVVGADKGGAVSLFDNFDIDYNAQKYLIETRCSGALVKPYSAVIFESKPAA